MLSPLLDTTKYEIDVSWYGPFSCKITKKIFYNFPLLTIDICFCNSTGVSSKFKIFGTLSPVKI